MWTTNFKIFMGIWTTKLWTIIQCMYTKKIIHFFVRKAEIYFLPNRYRLLQHVIVNSEIQTICVCRSKHTYILKTFAQKTKSKAKFKSRVAIHLIYFETLKYIFFNLVKFYQVFESNLDMV